MHRGQSLHQRPRRSLKRIVQHVLDGGALLHLVPWPKGSQTYKVVCDLYCTYVQKKNRRAIVVFDRYNEMSAKAMTQQRRTSGKAASTVTFTVTLKKDNFLSNPKNKQRFLSMLGKAFQNVGCITHHANGDADLLITKTAVKSTRTVTDCFAYNSIRLHRGHFAYMTEVVSPTRFELISLL